MDDSTADAILAAVDARADELVEAVAGAVRIPSVTPNFPGENAAEHLGREGDVARFVAEQLAPSGCEIDVFGVEAGRENCVGVLRGFGDGRSLIFNGHTDVVPPQPSEQWTGADPWSGRVADGKVWGRGSADMKGGILCQVFALRALVDAGVKLNGDLIVQAVVGEEMMEQQLGTIACLERGYRADAAVVAEPSPHALPLTVCAASCGFLLCEVTVEGKGTHSAMRAETIRPGRAGEVLGVHAIDHAIPVYEAVRRLEEQWGVDKRHPLFPPGSFTVHAGVAVGAPHRSLFPFSLAEYMRFTYVVWYPPDESAEGIKSEIEHQISHAAALDPWLREHPPEVVWPQHWGPARLEDPDHPIVAATGDAHEWATGTSATVGGFTAVSDATFLCDAGVPAISYGPGDIAAAHAIDEHVAVDELVAATRTFALLAADWCGTA